MRRLYGLWLYLPSVFKDPLHHLRMKKCILALLVVLPMLFSHNKIRILLLFRCCNIDIYCIVNVMFEQFEIDLSSNN
jgi:hypothetical protein